MSFHQPKCNLDNVVNNFRWTSTKKNAEWFLSKNYMKPKSHVIGGKWSAAQSYWGKMPCIWCMTSASVSLAQCFSMPKKRNLWHYQTIDRAFLEHKMHILHISIRLNEGKSVHNERCAHCRKTQKKRKKTYGWTRPNTQCRKEAGIAIGRERTSECNYITNNKRRAYAFHVIIKCT